MKIMGLRMERHLTAGFSQFRILPCVGMDAPRFRCLVSRTRFLNAVRGVSWQPASAPCPAEQETIVRAHRLTVFPRPTHRTPSDIKRPNLAGADQMRSRYIGTAAQSDSHEVSTRTGKCSMKRVAHVTSTRKANHAAKTMPSEGLEHAVPLP